jgi:hypothetical protein
VVWGKTTLSASQARSNRLLFQSLIIAFGRGHRKYSLYNQTEAGNDYSVKTRQSREFVDIYSDYSSSFVRVVRHMPTKTFQDLVDLMARLRAPDGCPWDREQTYATLAPMLDRRGLRGDRSRRGRRLGTSCATSWVTYCFR